MRQIQPVFPGKIQLPFKIKLPVLALGSQIKNTLCFLKNDTAYFSPIHADLAHPQDFFAFQKDVKMFLKKRPKIIACDLHPDYVSTKYVSQLSAISYQLSAIQHHHAHIVSCMAENGLIGQKVIGIAFDGTGLGDDQTLWGAEFLLCEAKKYRRLAHLQEIPLFGGEMAIRQPWRTLIAWLQQAYQGRIPGDILDFLQVNEKKWLVLRQMAEVNLNSPLASSMGRLFDAAGCLILGKQNARFEAELAISLEKLAARAKIIAQPYRFKVSRRKNTYILDPSGFFKQIILDLRSARPKSEIAYRFHLTVAQMTSGICLKLRHSTGINKVVLSGGVWQNKLLLSLVKALLLKENFFVFTYCRLPVSDASISLGQAVIASSRS